MLPPSTKNIFKFQYEKYDIDSKTKFLVISSSSFISGAELSLFYLLSNGLRNFNPILILPQNFSRNSINKNGLTYNLPLKWFYFTLNPVQLIRFGYSLILSSYYIHKIIIKQNIKFIFSNTLKAHVYAGFLDFFAPTQNILYVRDNIEPGLFYKLLIKRCHLAIAVSEFIYNQIPLPKARKKIVYNGVDINYWIPDKPIFKQYELEKRPIIVAQIGQITKWKNHTDFIKAAALIIKNYENVQFFIVGDDLSNREKSYRKELKTLVNELNISRFIFFLGQSNNIKELVSKIDILVHPAINEPFGRVLIEAMAMEKPVVAYRCGGPKEIIIDNRTGYLVEPRDVKTLAEKTTHLMKNEDLRIQFGKEGRKRVIENFSLDRYIKEMEEIFERI